MTPSPTPTNARPRGNRISKAELETRILKVVSMIEEGSSRTEILTACSSEYGVGRSTADRYIDSANQQLKEAYKPHVQRSAEIAKRRLEAIYRRAMTKEQLRTALLAQTQLNKIQGLCDNLMMSRLRMETTNQKYDF